MPYFFNIVALIITGSIIFLSIKYNLFEDKKIDKHKKLASVKKNYFLGGLIIILFLFYSTILQKNLILCLFYVSIFFVGFFSDLKFFNNPKKRILVQFIILFFFVCILDIKILETKFLPLDNIVLQNNILNFFFVVFCLMILINGSNFVDGINTLLISYIIMILLMVLFQLDDFIDDANTLKDLIFILFIVFLFNLFGIIILGDSGSYLLSLYLGLYLIELSNLNMSISPFFIVLLVWYPCFEVLFSIIRRKIKKMDSYHPDTRHLHQMLYRFVSSKNNFKKNFNHFITSFIIIIYNFVSFSIAFGFHNHTQNISFVILINIFVYIFSYNFLLKKIKNR